MTTNPKIIPTVGSYQTWSDKLKNKDGMTMEARIERFKSAGIKDEYLNWALRSYSEDGFTLNSLPEVFEYLAWFDELKTRKYLKIVREGNFSFNEADIESYCGLTGCKIKYVKPGLKVWLDQHHSADMEGINRRIEEKRKVSESAEKVFETDKIVIIHPLTQEASCTYGAGTKWCTAAEKNNMFNTYNSKGPLYILIDKVTNDKYQLHFETDQFMDAEDKPVSLKNLTQRYPEIKIWIDRDIMNKENAVKLSILLGDLELLKENIRRFGLTAEDIRSNNNFALRQAARNGHVNILRFLKDEFGLTAEDARDDNNDAIELASQNGHVDVLRFLKEEFGLTVKDARANNNYALLYAAGKGHLEVLRFLKEEFGLTVEDARVVDKYIRRTNKYGTRALDFLREEFGLQ